MHPLSGALSQLKDVELEAKISDLTKKYLMTNNTQLKQQSGMLLETYNMEINTRRAAEWERIMQLKNEDFKTLINIE